VSRSYLATSFLLTFQDNLSPDYQTVDPCVNFDALVCDGFNARHDIPEDRSSYSTGTIMSENGQTTLKHILEGPYLENSEVWLKLRQYFVLTDNLQHSSFSPKNLVRDVASVDEENFLKMQMAYASCMNETELQNLGVKPLISLIDRITKSFPVVEHGFIGSVDLSDTIVLLEQMGVTSFEGLTTGADDKNPVSKPSSLDILLLAQEPRIPS
jgi:endothelin-converting enzyme